MNFQTLREHRDKIKNGFDLFKLANSIRMNLDFQMSEEVEKKMSRKWNQV
jgi:hypothetical protein